MSEQNNEGMNYLRQVLYTACNSFVIRIHFFVKKFFPGHHMRGKKVWRYHPKHRQIQSAYYSEKNNDTHSGNDRADGILCKYRKKKTNGSHGHQRRECIAKRKA